MVYIGIDIAKFKHFASVVSSDGKVIVIDDIKKFNNYYIDKRSQGKNHRVALGHVCNKLVRVIFKLLTDDITFNLS